MNNKRKIINNLVFAMIGFIAIFNNSNDYLSSDVFAKEIQSKNNRLQQQIGPLITYESQQIGDREKLKVTVKVEDRSGTGIKEFRDHTGKLINGNSYTFEISRRGDYTFTAIDNNNQESSVKIDDFWVNPMTSNSKNQHRLNYGSPYWSSSNLREWLNSKGSVVNYTSNPPTNGNTGGFGYDKEVGFLNEFTEEEYDAILKTKHLVWIHNTFDSFAVESGRGDAGHLNYVSPVLMSSNPHVALDYKKYSHKADIDKIYLLSLHEIYWYLNRRGFDLKKYPTEQINKKYNLGNQSLNWWSTGSTEGGCTEYQYIMQNNGVFKLASSSNKKQGVVPAFNLNPSYVFEDGKKASELKIGDIITFGSYKGVSIEWQVINMSKSKIPLLLSRYAIDFKAYDASGDKSRIYSDYIKWGAYDMDYSQDVEYSPVKNSKDIEPPTITIENEEYLDIRHDNSFILNISVYDESGVKYVLMPDGNRVNSSSFKYEVRENGEYIFKCMDSVGNFNEFVVPVSNINQSPSLELEQSNENWSKSDVSIKIKSSNTVTQSINQVLASPGEYWGGIFPNYISYGGRSFKIKGSLKLISYDKSVLGTNSQFRLGVNYNSRRNKNKYSYVIAPTWEPLIQIPIDDIIAKETFDFEYDVLISNNYYNRLLPWGEFNIRGLDDKRVVELEIVDLTYEIKDDSDFAIQSIELPNGRVIKDVKEYTDTITEEGIYNLKYKVLDSRGITTEKTMTVKIDKTAPTLNLTYDKGELVNNRSTTVNVNASDSLSGIKRVKLPNGNYTTSLNASYVVNGNGSYAFECEDIAGNITSKTISINGNSSNLNTKVNKSDNWTNKGVQINIDLNK